MGQTVTLTAGDGHTLDGYRADPAGAAKGGVVVIQEIFGVNSHVRHLVDMFAGKGLRGDRACPVRPQREGGRARL